MKQHSTVNGYHAGHPWFYLLGGKAPLPKHIQATAIASDYKGYLAAQTYKADTLREPKRSQTLLQMRSKCCETLTKDLSRYRCLVRELRTDRLLHNDQSLPPTCRDIHTNLSLKYAHLFNGFAHLHLLGQLTSIQKDLFV